MANRVDAHCHLWSLARGDYGWLDAGNPALAPIVRDHDIADLRAADAAHGPCDRVLVQAAPTVAETEFLLRIAATEPDATAVVGWVDLTTADAPATLARLARDAHFKGVRPMLQDLPETDWIVTRPRPDAIAALVAHGLRFDALVVPQHLNALLRFATAHPDLPIVIDHAAKPALSAAADDPRHAMWRDGMARMARDTNAYCKLSGLLTELAEPQRETAKEIVRPVVEDLLAWFGPDRLMWGSDWPVLNLAGTMGGWRALSDDLLSGIDASDRDRILGGTAREFYTLGGAI